MRNFYLTKRAEEICPYYLRKVIAFLLLFVIVFLPVPTMAWSGKGHVIVTRMAVKLLIEDPNTPPELRAILIEGLGNKDKLNNFEDYISNLNNLRSFDPGLDSFSVRPDDLTASKSPIPAFGINEPLTHFLDSEFFNSDISKQKFSPDGSNKIKSSDLPRNPKDERYLKAGFITFRAEQSYKSLVESFRQNYSNDQVFLWIGYLSHYVADSYQPYHSTIDYRGYECPCNQTREKQYNLHSALEGLLFEDNSKIGQENRKNFLKYFLRTTEKLKQVQKDQIFDPYLIVQEALLSGYDYLPMLCNAGKEALGKEKLDSDKWFHYKEKVGNREISVLELKAERMAESAVQIKHLIIQAWSETQVKNVR